MKSVLRVAILAPYPAGALLPPDVVRPKYRQEHPSSWIRSLCMGLKNLPGIEFRVFVDSRAVTRRHEARDSGIDFTFMPKIEPTRFDPWHLYVPSRLRLGPLLREFKPDVVHGFGTESGYGLMAVLQDSPGIVSIQGIMEKLAPYMRSVLLPGSIGFLRFLERWVLARAAGMVVENEFAANWARSHAPHQRIRVIPHAVNPEFLTIQPDYSVQRLLCVGTLCPMKGVHTVLQAFANCRNKQARLCFVGDGPLRLSLMQAARDLNVAERVEFAGQMDRAGVMNEMRKSRGLVLGSRMDTSPNAVTEAHAAGLPVLSTQTGGLPELVDQGQDGFLVPVDDTSAIARGMEMLLEDADQCKRMGEAGRSKVRTLNEPSRIAQLHADFYREIVRVNP